MKKIRFVNALLTASNKGELANQNATYKLIALELYFNTIEILYFILFQGSCQRSTEYGTNYLIFGSIA